MTSAALSTDPSESIRKVLELTDSSELLPHFTRHPAAIEVAMRSALESLVALKFHRTSYLERLESADEIFTAVQWQIETLEGLRNRDPSEAYHDVIGLLTDSFSSPRLTRWSEIVQQLNSANSLLAENLTVALTAALRAHARSIDYIEPYVRGLPPGEMLDVTRAAKALDVTRPTIYEWLKKGRLVGWERGSTQGWVIPAEQIIGPHRVAEGIEDIVAEIGDAELAWDFLSNLWPFAGGAARPIEKLIEGGSAAKQVIDAAPGYLCNMG